MRDVIDIYQNLNSLAKAKHNQARREREIVEFCKKHFYDEKIEQYPLVELYRYINSSEIGTIDRNYFATIIKQNWQTIKDGRRVIVLTTKEIYKECYW